MCVTCAVFKLCVYSEYITHIHVTVYVCGSVNATVCIFAYSLSFIQLGLHIVYSVPINM